ncbi:MAG: histidine kinase dimerization/phosphoacceptor domain -containing protein [Polyangiaceae bacterium]
MEDRQGQSERALFHASWHECFRSLAAVSRAISAAPGREAALRIAVEAAVSLTSAEAGVLLTLSADGRARVQASSGASMDVLRSFSAPLDGHLREALSHALALPAERLLGVPVSVGGRDEGLLAVLIPSGERFEEERTLLLECVADRVALALEDAARAREQRALAEISEVLASSSLEYGETQHRVARLAVDLLGGICGIIEARADGRLGRVVVLGADPSMQAVARRMQRLQEIHTGSILARAAASRASVLLHLEDVVPVHPGDEERLRVHRALGMRTLLAIPMMSRGQLVGVLGLSSTRDYAPSDVSLAHEVARRAAGTIDNARLYEESRFQAAVAANLAEGITLMRLDTQTITFANARIEEMLGYGPGEMIGKHVSSFVPYSEEARGALVATVRRAAEKGGSWHGEIQALRKDGSVFWSSVSASIFDHPEMGKVLLSARTDISARKALEEATARALREKDVLLKEVHHRVKNNLQVIASLFYLQRRRAIDPQVKDLLDESRSRIESIALIHEQLYQANSLAHIDFHEYLNRLLAAILSAFDPKNIRAHSRAPGIVLDVNQAVPCALVVSELLSNSLKHAFRDRGGEVWVTAHLEDRGNVVLEVGDDGVGFPRDLDWRAARGLGLHLVQGLTKQLRGTLELDSSRGARFTLRFPIASPYAADVRASPG